MSGRAQRPVRAIAGEILQGLIGDEGSFLGRHSAKDCAGPLGVGGEIASTLPGFCGKSGALGELRAAGT